MPALGSLWYTLGIDSKQIDADLKSVEAKLKNLGVTVDVSKVRQTIEASVGATPFNATVNFGNARASLDAIFANKKYDVHVEAIASKLHESIKNALANFSTGANILPKKKELRKAVNDALLSAGFEINIGKVKGLNATINNALGSAHTLNVSVDPKKLASAIDKAVGAYKGGKQVSVEVKDKILKDSITTALKTEKFPIRVIVDKAEAQDAVRQALQAAGLQSRTGFTASDKRAWDAQSRRMEAEARAAAASALAQRRLAGARTQATNAADKHATATVLLNSALKGNITLTKELGGAIGAAYSVVALKNFMTKVVEIGGELEKQKLAMKAILGDEGMANTISSQINTLAVKSPFGIMELNQYAKQLTAFQIPYNELYDTMKRMADVSAAVGVDMGRIILAYGQVRAAKFLKGTELRQFTEANIPLIDMLAERFTKLKGEIVSAGDIMDMISNKEVSFEDVKAVLWELTGEGGRFYNMQEVLSESVSAKWKNLADAIDLMFAEIADSTSGPLKWTAEMLTTLAASWEKIGAVLAANIAIFGSYKVTQLALNRAIGIGVTNTLKSAQSLKQKAAETLRLEALTRKLTDKEKALIATSQKLTAADYVNLASTKQLTKQKALLLIGLRRLDANSIGHIAKILNISKAEIKAAQSTKKWILQAKLLGTSLKNAFVSIGSAILNPMTAVMAAVSAGTYLWQRHSEQASQAKEFGDNMFTAAVEQGKNLREVIKGIGADIQNLDEAALRQAFERLSTAIKDYAPNGEKVLLESKFDAEGNRRKLDQQVSYLDEYLKRMEQAAALAEKIQIDTIVESATKANSGVFDDAWKKDIADLAEQYTAQTGYITQFAQKYRSKMREIVDTAINVDKGFATASEGMKTYEEKFKYLAVNITRYTDAMDAVYQEHAQKSSKRQQDILFERFMPSGRLADAENEAMKEAREFFEALVVGIEQAGVDIKSDAGKGLVEFASKSIFDEFKILAPQYQDQLRNLFNEVTGLEFDDTFLRQQVSDKLMNLISEAGGKLAEKIRNGEELTDAEQELLDKIKSQAVKTVGDELPADLKTKLDGFAADNVWWLKIFAAFEPEQIITDWQKAMFETFGNNPEIVTVIKSAADPASALRAIAELRDEAQSRLDKNFLILGIKPQFTPLDTENITDPVAKKVAENINKDLSTTNAANNQTEYNLNAFGRQRGGSGTPKDPLAESLKQRFKDIKDAWSEFQKWSKTEGREAAATRIGESGLFSTLSADKIPQTVEQYRALVVELENELRQAGVKGTARESLLNDLLKQLLDIDKTVVDEQLKLALDKVSKEAERQLADWNLFDKIRKATGNQDLAMSIAFGMNADATTDYPTMIKNQFAEVAKQYKKFENLTFDMIPDESYLTEAPKEIQEAYKKATDALAKYAREQKDAIADILNEYQSLQDKLTKIDAERQRKIEVVSKSDMSAPDKAKYIQRINVEADYQKFQQSNEYLQFFAGIYALTQQEATQIGDLIEQHLNRQLQAGALSAEDYYKEIERVRQQLDKLRNVKSDSLTFMTGGVKGLNDKRKETNASARLETIQNIATLEDKLQKAREAGDKHQEVLLMAQLRGAKEELTLQDKIRDKIIQNEQQWQRVLDVANIAANIAGGMSDAFNTLRDMADSFGFDTESNAWETAAAVMDTLTTVTGGVQKVIQSAMSGDIGGIIGGAFDTLLTPFTIWNKLHDKKLQKQIEQYQKLYDLLDNQLALISERLNFALGSARQIKDPQAEADKEKYYAAVRGEGRYGVGALGKFAAVQTKLRYKRRVEAYEEGGVYAYQRELMREQRNSLIGQRNAETEKKDSDSDAIEGYNQQIAELDQQIRDFAESTIETLYGINIRGFAEDIGSALIDAFSKGEDAAEAFDKAVGDIMRDVVKQMAIKNILEKQFEGMRTFLFGNDGMSGAFGKDFYIDEEEAATLKEYFDKIKNEGIPAVKQLYDSVNEATGGLLDDTESAKSGLSAGIQSVTEDTGSLVASYCNGIRGDVSVQTHDYWPRLLDDALPQMNVIAQSQLDTQRQIAENTLRNAVAAEAIQVSTAKLVELNDQMGRSWRRIAEKNWGYS